MPKKGHPEEQIIAALQQVEGGSKVAEVCWQTGISEGTFYSWKKQYAGLQSEQVREIKQLQEQNARLKKLLGDAMLDNAILKDLLGKS